MIPVLGDSGMMGGSLSHEFHYTVPVGEDTLLICNKCNGGINKQIESNITACDTCGNESFSEAKGIEVIPILNVLKPLNRWLSKLISKL